MPSPSVLAPPNVPAHRVTYTSTVAGMLFVALVALAFGWPTRLGGYIAGDDERLALNHVYVNHPSLANAARLLTIVHGDLYQPLPVLSFQLNYALAKPSPDSTHGVSLYGFHLTNILLHAANAALVFLVASRLVPARRDRRIGLLTALFFACHPFAVEPVAWISGRTILLATLFSLILLLELPFGRSPIASTLAWLLALGSKVLPTVPIAAMWCDWRLNGSIPPRRRSIYALLILITAAATWFVYRATSEAGFIDAMQAEPADPVPIRILLAGRYYLESYVWPNRLAGWSPPPQGHNLASPAVLIALVEYAALLILIALTWRRQRTICLGLVLFLILIAPFLAASVARRFLAADRYMYLPIVGLHLAVASAAIAVFDALRRRLGPVTAALPTMIPATACLIAWFIVGWRLGPTWSTNVTRNQRALDVYGDNVLAHVELAKAYVIEKLPDEALITIAKARTRWPDHPRLAGVAGEAHRLKKQWSAAAGELSRAAAGLPHHLWTLYYLARTYDDMGEAARARALYTDILDQHASYFPALVALARNHEKSGNIPAAIEAYERAITINPHDRDALLSLAVLRIRQKDWPDAEWSLQSILRLDPNDPAALLNLGVILARTNRPTEALTIYDRLLARDPAASTPRLNRAALLGQLNRPAEAEADYRAVLAAHPDHYDAAVGLHELLQQQHREPELPAHWRKVAAAGTAGVQPWIVWSEALAGNSESAQRAATTIASESRDRPFTDWALAYLALRENRTQDFKDILSKFSADPSVTHASLQQARIIRLALLNLPDPLRDSPAVHFALANAFLYDRQTDAARAVLSQLMQSEKGGGWGEAAEDLYRRIEDAGTRPTTSAPRSSRMPIQP
ncbi:MAG TPA: tetratricopeptide repeat protein [Phycisphaerae bacterium]|nr:tetratricopeptide repeat protein [Phycisphaerae bacterium]